MKNQADKKSQDVNLQVGDLVLVKLQPYKQHSAALRKNHKLGMHFFGPFKILARVRAVAYKLELPAEARIHNVFHVSQLKLFKGTPGEQYLRWTMPRFLSLIGSHPANPFFGVLFFTTVA